MEEDRRVKGVLGFFEGLKLENEGAFVAEGAGFGGDDAGGGGDGPVGAELVRELGGGGLAGLPEVKEGECGETKSEKKQGCPPDEEADGEENCEEKPGGRRLVEQGACGDAEDGAKSERKER